MRSVSHIAAPRSACADIELLRTSTMALTFFREPDGPGPFRSAGRARTHSAELRGGPDIAAGSAIALCADDKMADLVTDAGPGLTGAPPLTERSTSLARCGRLTNSANRAIPTAGAWQRNPGTGSRPHGVHGRPLFSCSKYGSSTQSSDQTTLRYYTQVWRGDFNRSYKRRFVVGFMITLEHLYVDDK